MIHARRTHLTAAIIFLAAVALALPAAYGATPNAGTVSDTNYTLTWSGTSLVTTPTPTAYDPSLCPTLQDCDAFDVTVTVSDAYRTAHPNFVVRVRVDWGSAPSDFDLFLYKGSEHVDYSGQSLSNFEEIEESSIPNGTYR